MFYFEVFEALYRERIKYLLVGGLAVNLHGVPRVTYDIDIIILTDRDNILKLNNTLLNLGYIPRLPVNPNDMANEKILNDWIENRNMKAFSFYNVKENRKIIDIVIEHPLDFTKAFQHKVLKKVDDVEIYVASIDDMISMKKVSNRPKDINDMEMLMEVKKILESKK
ncbi:MAG: hypothetical protein HY738_07530 [Bacteroidia bacterium]|nr:hypothetical protein [Bacteroidia bacterium]